MARTFAGGSATDNIELSITTRPASRTISFLYNRTSDGGGSAGRIFAQGSDFITTNNSGKIQINFDWSTDGIWITDAVHLSAGTPVHVVITYDGSSTANDPVFYINGASVAITESTAPVGTRNTGTAALYVGNNSALNRALDGALSEFAMWDRALTAAEVLALYQGSPLNVPDFIVYLPLVRETVDYANAAPTLTGTTVSVHPRVVYTAHTFASDYTPVVVIPPAAPLPVFRTYVDWDNNGNFTGTYDEITTDVKALRWRIGFRDPFKEIADENTASITLKNTDGKYNPENASSVLYGKLLPGRRMQITFDDQINPEVVMYTGWIEFPQSQWKPAGAYTAKTEAVINGVGAKYYLDNLELVSDYYTNVTGDEIIEDILTASGLTTVSTDFSLIDAGLTVFASYGDNQGNLKAYKQIEEISKMERGRFYFDRQSRGVWWNRHHLLSVAVPVAAINDDSGDYKPVDLDYKYGRWLANIIRVDAAPRRSDGSETLWNLDQDITIYVGQIQTFEAKLRRSTGQYAASSALIATPTFSAGNCTVTVTEKGNIAILTLDNSAGSENAILTGLSLTGSIIRDQNQMTIEVSDTGSMSTYGKRGWSFDVGPSTDHASILSAAQYELNRRKDAQGDVGWVKYKRASDGIDNAHQITWEIGDLVTVTLLNGHTANYWIIGEDHFTKMDGVHETTFYLEFGAPGTFWLLDVAGFSELGETTVLGF